MMSQTYAHDDVAAMLKIAGEVAELPVDVHVRRGHVLSGLLGLIGGCSAVCCEMDARHVADGSGWAIPGSITRAGGAELSAGQRELIECYVSGAMGPDALDPCASFTNTRRQPESRMRAVNSSKPFTTPSERGTGIPTASRRE